MRSRHRPAPSATSLDQSPQDDETARMKQYVLTMAIRTVCLVLAFVVQPWGWHTAVFCVGAVFLPYIAVVFANQANARPQASAESPKRAIESSQAPAEATDEPDVFRVSESPEADERRDAT